MRYYTAVVELLSFSAAARRLNIAQSAISRQIKALEQELGIQLLDRSRSHVALTIAGESFYHDVRRLLTDVDLAAAHARRIARERKGRRGRNRPRAELP